MDSKTRRRFIESLAAAGMLTAASRAQAMITENDRALLARRAASAPRPMPDPESDPELVAQYRRQMDAGDVLANADPLPDVAAYHPAFQLRPGLTAGIAVPHGPGPFPVMLHCHGNGFIAGSARSYRRFTMDCARGGFLTILPDYRLAPENKWPAGFDDLVFAANWARDHSGQFKGDGRKLLVTGNSVGGGISLSLARYLQTTPGSPKIAGVASMDGLPDNYGAFIANPKAGRARRISYWASSTDPERIRDPRISPGQGLRPGMLPPAILLTTGSADFAAPETLAFAVQLRALNIPFELRVFEGMPHDAAKQALLDGGREQLEVLFRFGHAAVARYA